MRPPPTCQSFHVPSCCTAYQRSSAASRAVAIQCKTQLRWGGRPNLLLLLRHTVSGTSLLVCVCVYVAKFAPSLLASSRSNSFFPPLLQASLPSSPPPHSSRVLPPPISFPDPSPPDLPARRAFCKSSCLWVLCPLGSAGSRREYCAPKRDGPPSLFVAWRVPRQVQRTNLKGTCGGAAGKAGRAQLDALADRIAGGRGWQCIEVLAGVEPAQASLQHVSLSRAPTMIFDMCLARRVGGLSRQSKLSMSGISAQYFAWSCIIACRCD